MFSSYRAILLAGLLLVGCDVGVQTFPANDHPNDAPASIRAFVESMEEGDVESFVADLNKVRGDPEPEVLTYLVSLWRDARSETPPRFLQNDLVLVELASTLAQTRRGAATDFDDPEFRGLLRGAAQSGDEEVRRRAALGLAYFEDPMDVPILAEMAGDTDEGLFRTAVIVLLNMCIPEAAAALERTEPLLSRKRRAFLTEARAEYQTARVC